MRQRAPSEPLGTLGEGVRAQRVPGAGRVFGASPVPQHQLAVALAAAGMTGGADGTVKFYRDRFVLAGATGDQSLTYLPAEFSPHVYLNGVYQDEDTDYTLVDQTLTVETAMGAASGDVLEVRYAYLSSQSVVAEDAVPVALFRWDGAASPSTGSGNQPWTVANGTYYGGTQRNGSGSGNGWQSDCHAHKTVTAQPVLACGYAIRNSGTSAGYSWTTDTDGDDFGIMSFCGDSGATCHINLTFNGSNEIEVRRGKGGTLIATSTSPLPNDIVGEWIYLIGQVKVDDSAGYVKVWMQREAESTPTLIVDFTGDTRNGGTSLDLDTIKIGGFYPINVVIDDLYLATGSLGDPGDVTSLDIP